MGRLIFLILFLFFGAVSFAADDKDKIHDLPGEIRYRITSEYDQLSHKLAEELFTKIEDFKIFETSNETTNFKVKIGRTIFDNHDVFSSYTVVDTIQMPFQLYGWSELIGDFSRVSLNFGVGGNFTLKNLRQVGRTQLPNLEDINKKAAEISNTDWMRTALDSPNPPDPNNPPYTEIPGASESDPFFWLDSMNKARFSKLWNMVAYPARLPFKADWVKKLDDGEIMVYGGSGYVELGPSFGTSKQFEGFGEDVEFASLYAGWRYFLSGEFSIAVLKVADNKVKLKFRRYLQSGQRAFFGASASRLDIWDGFGIAGKHAGRIGFNIRPFNLNWQKSGGPILEIGYEFDLNQPEGREAYESAAIGKLAKADTLAEEHKGEDGAAVKNLFHKKGREDLNANSRDSEFIIYSRNRKAEQRNSDVKLKLNDGEHGLYSAIAENTLEAKVRFGSRERLVTKTTIDHNSIKSGMVIEGWIDDTSTDAVELNEYEDIVEKTLNRGKIFERVPIFAPYDPHEISYGNAFPNEHPPKIAETGKSSFYYRMDIDEAMISTFVKTPVETRWKIMEKVFGVPEGSWASAVDRFFKKALTVAGGAVNFVLYPFDLRVRGWEALYVADHAIDAWEEIATATEPKDFTYKLGKFFSDSVYGPEMMQAFSIAVESHKPPFFLTATNYSFGRVQLQEGNFSNVGKTIEEYRRASQIDSPQVGYNVSLSVKSLSVEVLDENRVKLTFDLPVKPRFLYFRVTKTGFVESSEKELVVLNFDQASEGTNTIILDKNENNYRGALARGFLSRAYYKVYLGIGVGGREWGPLLSQSLYYQYSPDSPEPNR